MNWKQETEGLIEIIEIYFKKGGWSELPNEVINDIESTLEEQTEEIEKLNNIIKEIRADIEDIKSNHFKRYDDEVYKLCDNILETLDKGNKV